MIKSLYDYLKEKGIVHSQEMDYGMFSGREMDQIVFDYLESKGVIDLIKNNIGKISLKIIDDDIVISGNRLELIMLADYILNAALADFNGWHIHLDELNFFDEVDKGLIISLDMISKNESGSE